MRVALGTIEISDYERRALAHRYGNTGLATRNTVRQFVLDNGLQALDANVIPDYEADLERGGENE